jgi:hypothetical protein
VAGIGFERIWRAYGRYGNKQSSRRAFEAIADPDVDYIAKRAASWAASAKPGQRRMPLEKWLEQERYDEADRNVKPREARVERLEEDHTQEDGDVRRKSEGVDAAQAAEDARAIRRAAIELHVEPGAPLTVMMAELKKRGEDTWLALKTDGGNVALVVEGGTGHDSLQEEGQAHLARLADACGIAINEPADLCGKRFMVIGDTFAAPTAA